MSRRSAILLVAAGLATGSPSAGDGLRKAGVCSRLVRVALEPDADMAWRVGSEFTMSEILERLVAEGYVADFRLNNGVRCPNDCAGPATVDSTWRFEGASDPDDESIVLALRCPVCGMRGVLTTAYGAMLTGPEALALAELKPTAR